MIKSIIIFACHSDCWANRFLWLCRPTGCYAASFQAQLVKPDAASLHYQKIDPLPHRLALSSQQSHLPRYRRWFTTTESFHPFITGLKFIEDPNKTDKSTGLSILELKVKKISWMFQPAKQKVDILKHKNNSKFLTQNLFSLGTSLFLSVYREP